MREWIRGLPFKAEFLIVVLGAFGLSLAAVIRLLLTPEWWLHGPPPFTNASLTRTVIFEVIVGALIWKVLAIRGWTPEKVGLTPVRPWIREVITAPIIAIGLLLAIYVAYLVLLIIVNSVQSDLIAQAIAHRPRVAHDMTTPTMVVASLINPVFEEVFVCGYVVSSLRERIGAANAVSVSAGIRLAYHLYQGPVGVLGITPFALVAAIWFVRTQRLAPLIVAHAIVDFTGLALGRAG